MVGNRRRTIIVHHPDFDIPGAQGVLEAKQFAEQLIVGQKGMVEHARNSGETPETILQIERYISQLRVLVRFVDEEVI